ncbi:hypothetical protein RHGRI_020334 [Rhododendron griersonianum]|uniref:Uncharacterized protein n=1 Tax=Rhododendron griersonianum TaxID=479676 RepID=A0AAV6JJW6_9ERIC|nr:hypothetical protein RHGRI_020334 [Rhododendron griersonianum]
MKIERCIQILSRETKNNPIIIGEPGKARTDVVEGLSQGMVYGDVSEILGPSKVDLARYRFAASRHQV